MSQEKPACGYITQPPSLITPPPSHITTPLSHITPPMSHHSQPHLISHHITFVSHHTHPSHVTPPLSHISCQTTSHVTPHLTSHVTPPPSHISCHTTTISHLMSHYLHLTSPHTTFISDLPSVASNCANAMEKTVVISKLFSRSCGYMNRGTVNVGDVYLFTQTPRKGPQQ